MALNLFIIFVSLFSGYLAYAYYVHARTCLEISAKNKIDFFKKAKEMLESETLNDFQKAKVFRWADTIDSREHAGYLTKAVAHVHREISKGRFPSSGMENEEEYTSDLAELFVLWMFSLLHANVFMAPFSRDSLIYILTTRRNHKSVDMEVTKDVFKYNDIAMAA